MNNLHLNFYTTFSFGFSVSIILLSVTSCIASESEDDEASFTYIEGTGKGPKEWGHINPHWQVFDNGKMQSPIDLLDRRVQALPNLGKLHRNYKPAPAVVKNRGHDTTESYLSSLLHPFDNENIHSE